MSLSPDRPTWSLIMDDVIIIVADGPVIDVKPPGPGPVEIQYKCEVLRDPPRRFIPRDNGHPKRWRP